MWTSASEVGSDPCSVTHKLIHLASLSLSFFVCSVEMTTGLIHIEVKVIKQDNACKAFSTVKLDCSNPSI